MPLEELEVRTGIEALGRSGWTTSPVPVTRAASSSAASLAGASTTATTTRTRWPSATVSGWGGEGRGVAGRWVGRGEAGW